MFVHVNLHFLPSIRAAVVNRENQQFLLWAKLAFSEKTYEKHEMHSKNDCLCYNHQWRTCNWRTTLCWMNITKQTHGCGQNEEFCPQITQSLLSPNSAWKLVWGKLPTYYNLSLRHVPALHALGTRCASVSLVDERSRHWNAVKIINLEMNKKYVAFGNFRLSL